MTWDNGGAWVALLGVLVLIEIVQVLRRAPTLSRQWRRAHRALKLRYPHGGRWVMPVITLGSFGLLVAHLWGGLWM